MAAKKANPPGRSNEHEAPLPRYFHIFLCQNSTEGWPIHLLRYTKCSKDPDEFWSLALSSLASHGCFRLPEPVKLAAHDSNEGLLNILRHAEYIKNHYGFEVVKRSWLDNFERSQLSAFPKSITPDFIGGWLEHVHWHAERTNNNFGWEVVARASVPSSGLDTLANSAEVRVMAPAAPLAAEIAAFDRDLPQLLTTDLGRFSVYVGAERVGTFATESEAFDAGYDRTQFQRPFLMRRVEPNHEGTASSWQMGRPIA
jgi:hypothetical protein